MSQYTSRFYIIVKDTSEWRRLLEDYDLEKFGLYIPDDYDKKTYYMDDTCILEIDLDIFVEFIMNCLGKDVLVIADTTNYNVDPYNYCVYLINGKMKTKCFENGPKSQMFFKTNIGDAVGWLNFGGFTFSEEDAEWLKTFGIEGVKIKKTKKK